MQIFHPVKDGMEYLHLMQFFIASVASDMLTSSLNINFINFNLDSKIMSLLKRQKTKLRKYILFSLVLIFFIAGGILPYNYWQKITGYVTGVETQAWKYCETGNIFCNNNWDYTMGYKFTPNQNGKITQLCGYFSGTKPVTLYDSSYSVLASTQVASSNAWSCNSISPVKVNAGSTYYVVAYLAGSGGCFRNSRDNTFPRTCDKINLDASVQQSGNSFSSSHSKCPDAENTRCNNAYGLVDVIFSTEGIVIPPITMIISPPAIVTSPATNIKSNQAQLNGSIIDLGNDSSAEVWFEWGADINYGSTTAHQTKTSSGEFSSLVSGLSPGTAYHFRAVAKNSAGIAYGIDKTFTTTSFVIKIKEQLSSCINYIYTTWTYRDEKWVGFNPISPDWTNDLIEIFPNEKVSIDIKQDCVLAYGGYTYNLKQGWNQLIWEPTRLTIPQTTTNPATNIKSNQAQLNGNLVSLGGDASTEVWFEWGADINYGSTTAHQTKTSSGEFSSLVSGLPPGTAYHFRAVAKNSVGIAYGIDKTFTIPALLTENQVWKYCETGNIFCNNNWDYTMGYKFTPAKNGQVSKLCGYFQGTKTVKLYDSSYSVLASAQVSSSNAWSCTPVSPVAVSAGSAYYVLVYLAGSGGCFTNSANNIFPKACGNAQMNADVWQLGDRFDSSHTECPRDDYAHCNNVNGMADIVFLPETTTAVSNGSALINSSPPMASISINNNAEITTSTYVNLSLSCSGPSTPLSVRYSNDNVTWSPPTGELFALTKPSTLLPIVSNQLFKGWNYVKYAGTTQSIDTATSPIASVLSNVWYYNATERKWSGYSAGAPVWASDLQKMVNGEIYRVHVTSIVTWNDASVLAAERLAYYQCKDNVNKIANVSDSIVYDSTGPFTTSIVSVEGDTTAPYVDTTDNGKTTIVVNGESGIGCTLNETDGWISSNSPTICPVSGSQATCVFSPTANGQSYIKSITCFDFLGNTQSPAQNLDVTWTVTIGGGDTTPPSTSTSSVAGDASPPYRDTVNDAQTSIVVSGEAGMSCRWGATDVVYSSMTNECTVAGSTATCSPGSLSQSSSYTIFVSCKDANGNEQLTDSSRPIGNKDVVFGVDWTSPFPVSVSHSPASPTTADKVTFTATASDNVGVTSSIINVDGANITTCASSPCSYTGGPYAASTHTYYATAIDAAGNTGRDPPTGSKSFSVTTKIFEPAFVNKKDAGKYDNKEIFLISDQNWQNILSLVPITTWTDNGTGAISKYPTLIYYQEGEDFDADSVIYFIQQYNPQKVTIVGASPPDLDSLLVAAMPVGGGLSSKQIKRITPNDYFSYWKSYHDAVYVKNDYSTALMASNYASLINAPLVIEGNEFGDALSGKNIICIGNPAGAACNENYNLYQIQEKYVKMTNTDKLIMVNPDDLDIAINDRFGTEKSGDILHKLFTRHSLAAPFLAAGKHELIINTAAEDYSKINNLVRTTVDSFNLNPRYLTIIASPEAIAMSQPEPNKIYYQALDYEYGNLDEDGPPELAVGRIYSLSVSDVSSYIARSLFYSAITAASTRNVYLKGVLMWDFEAMAYAYGNIFSSAGYSSNVIVGQPEGTPPNVVFQGDPNDWKNKQLILFMDHTGPSAVDIYSEAIPYLDSPVIIGYGCSNCVHEKLRDTDRLNGFKWFELFCINAIRKGAMGYIGSVSEAGYIAENMFLFNVYSLGNDIGTAFKETNKLTEEWTDFLWGGSSGIWVLLGDPTFKPDTGNKIIPLTELKAVNEYPGRKEYDLTFKNKYRNITKDAFKGRDVILTSQSCKKGYYVELISSSSYGIIVDCDKVKSTLRFELGPLQPDFNLKGVKIESDDIASYNDIKTFVNVEGKSKFVSVYIVNAIVKPEKIKYDDKWHDFNVKIILYKG